MAKRKFMKKEKEIKEEIEKAINHSWDGTLYALNKNTLEYIDVTDIIFEDLLSKTLQRFTEETKIEEIKPIIEIMVDEDEEVKNEKFNIETQLNRSFKKGYNQALKDIYQTQAKWLKENL